MSVAHQQSEGGFSEFISELGGLVALALLAMALAILALSTPELQPGIEQVPNQVHDYTNASPSSHITWPGTTGGV